MGLITSPVFLPSQSPNLCLTPASRHTPEMNPCPSTPLSFSHPPLSVCLQPLSSQTQSPEYAERPIGTLYACSNYRQTVVTVEAVL